MHIVLWMPWPERDASRASPDLSEITQSKWITYTQITDGNTHSRTRVVVVVVVAGDRGGKRRNQIERPNTNAKCGQ